MPIPVTLETIKKADQESALNSLNAPSNAASPVLRKVFALTALSGAKAYGPDGKELALEDFPTTLALFHGCRIILDCGTGPQGTKKCEEIFNWLRKGGYFFARSAATHSSKRDNEKAIELKDSVPKAFWGLLRYYARKWIPGRKSDDHPGHYGANVGISKGGSEYKPSKRWFKGACVCSFRSQKRNISLGNRRKCSWTTRTLNPWQK